MPPSLNQGNTNSPSYTPQPNKPIQKAQSAESQIQAKNGRRKNGAAKDSAENGVMAAVTKNASKMS
jgi:hypothetical protein